MIHALWTAFSRTAALIATATLLGGCLGTASSDLGSQGTAASMSEAGARLDEAAARDMINAYRARNGQPPVALEPRLTAVAKDHARQLAEAGRRGQRMDSHHRFKERLESAGYGNVHAAEAVGYGYRNMDRAFTGWRDSPNHRRIMLMGQAEQMGIAAYYSPQTNHKVYWVLVMAGNTEEPGGFPNPLRFLLSFAR